MKKFLIRIIVFFTIFGILFSTGFFLPATPKASDFYLFSKLEKDSLMRNVSSPRIIFIGGSNVVFGLNSEIIKDSLKVNPINTGLTASVGLVYMMDNILPNIKKGDVVVIAPEYQQFYKSFAFGGNDLVRVLFDVDKSSVTLLGKKQWINVLKNYPKYFVSKFNPMEYFGFKINPNYKLNIINEYGDSNNHWVLEKQGMIKPSQYFKGKFNHEVLNRIKNFDSKLKQKGATLFVTYPCYQTISFEINHKQIGKIETELNNSGLKILGTAERYKMSDSIMFDSPYHLIKKGVDLRTQLLIEDLLPYVKD